MQAIRQRRATGDQWVDPFEKVERPEDLESTRP
jgi:hypothetical protein